MKTIPFLQAHLRHGHKSKKEGIASLINRGVRQVGEQSSKILRPFVLEHDIQMNETPAAYAGVVDSVRALQSLGAAYEGATRCSPKYF